MSIPPHATKPVPHTQCGLAEWALVRPTRTLCLDVVSLLPLQSPLGLTWDRLSHRSSIQAAQHHVHQGPRRGRLRCVSAGVHLSARPASQ